MITNQIAETPGLFAIANSDTARTNPLPLAVTRRAPTLQQDSEQKTNEVYVTGISTMNGKVVVFLSNGEAYTSDDRELQFVTKRKAIIAGQKLCLPTGRPVGERGNANRTACAALLKFRR